MLQAKIDDSFLTQTSILLIIFFCCLFKILVQKYSFVKMFAAKETFTQKKWKVMPLAEAFFSYRPLCCQESGAISNSFTHAESKRYIYPADRTRSQKIVLYCIYKWMVIFFKSCSRKA